jgi:hypothetical protein
MLLGGFALVALAAAGILIGAGAFGGGASLETLPTTGMYRPITVKAPLIPHAGFNGPLVVDPDSTIRQGQDIQMIVTPGSQPNHYSLTFTNSSSIGWINQFRWFPPAGVSIVKVTGSTKGHCDASGTTGFGGNQFKGVVLNPEIVCTDVNLHPPSCTCRGDGGVVTVSVVTSKAVKLPGSARVDAATPVLKIIPSAPPQQDLPTCAAGQTSTAANPCTTT